MFHSRKTAKNERVLQLVKGLTSLMLQIRVRVLTCLVKNRRILPHSAPPLLVLHGQVVVVSCPELCPVPKGGHCMDRW